jgi:putative protease
VKCRGKKVVSEVMLEKAEKRPLNKEVLAGQLGRLGGTEFQLGLVQNLLEGEVMIPLGELNRVRRRLVEELKEEPAVKDGRAVLVRLMPKRGVLDEGLSELRVLCRSLEQVEGCARAGACFVYCDFEDLKEYREAVAIARKGGMKVFLGNAKNSEANRDRFF